MQARARFRGFTLIELLVVIAIIALLIGILLPALGEARRAARTTISTSNQRQLATGMNSYATDYKDRIPSFNWRGSPTKPASFSEFGDLNGATTDIQAAADQAVDVIRRRTGRTNFPKITGWIPHILYNHLTMMDYLASRLPEKIMACPEDRHRQNWQKDPENNFDKNVWAPFQADGGVAANRRWPYSATYRPTISAFDTGPAGSRIHQVGMIYNQYITTNAKVSGTKLSSVMAPSQKVFMYEAFQYHVGKKVSFFAYPLSKYTVVTFDGAVTFRNNPTEVNKGWIPNSPASASPTTFFYDPVAAGAPWDPPPANPDGNTQDNLIGYVQYTRGGLVGIDFGGTEIGT
jgi:prepilin-type N-terminal cleavage/methylation domain-containing protein